MSGFSGPGVDAWLGWLATYAIHSTFLMGGALLLARRLPSDAWRETVWRAAILGGLVTATLQSGTGAAPLAGRWVLPSTPVEALPAATTPLDAPAANAVGPQLPTPEVARSDEAPGVMAAAAAPSGQQAAFAAPGSPSQDEVTSTASTTGASIASGAETALLPWLLLAWITGAALLTGRIARQHLRLHRLLGGRRVVDDPAMTATLAELTAAGRVSRPVRLTASELCPTPLALGRGEICVPERLLALDHEQRRSALAHELAHLARRDPEWRLMTGILGAVFFFQPLNRVALRALRDLAEQQCDDWAVRRTGSPLGLVRCLMEVAVWLGADWRLTHDVPAMADTRSPLVRRVERLLLSAPRPEAPRRWMRAAAALGLVSLTAVAAPAVSPDPAHSAGLATLWRSALTPPTAQSYREEVIAHPAPNTPLDDKWAWATREAGQRGHGERWVAWSIERPVRVGERIMEDSHPWSSDELAGEPIGSLLLGAGYRAPAEAAGSVRQPLIVLFHLRGNDIDRVAVRSASLAMMLGGHPVYWLGPTAQAQSFDWLVARADRMPSIPLEGAVVETIALHEDSERVVPFLEGVIGSDRAMQVRAEAVEGLAWHATERSVVVLRGLALGGGPGNLGVEAAETLGEVENPAAEAALVEVVSSGAPREVRGEAVEAMGERRSSPGIAEELNRIVYDDPDEWIQAEAVETLGELPPATVVPLLERIASSHPRRSIQEEAFETLADIDPERANRLLEQMLSDPAASAELRMEALGSLARAEGHSTETLALVQQAALADPSPRVQREAVEALTEFSPADAAPLLERLIWEHPLVEARVEAVEATGELPADLAAPILDRVLREHEQVEVAAEAVQTLEELPRTVAVPLLLRTAREHARPEVREEARDLLVDAVRWR